MAKQFLEDMIQAKRERRGSLPASKIPKDVPPKEVRVKKIIPRTPDVQKRSSRTIWIVAVCSAAFCFFAFSFWLGGAKVTVDPKIEEVALSEDLSAVKDSSASNLSFDLVVISGDESKVVTATGERDVADKAGTVVLFNTFSSAPQNLDINTRLEGSNGKMYKTLTKVVVPGMMKGGTPGSVEVKIYANEAGSEYNSAPLDFKIFGFKGTSKYEKFYGRSKGEITGGFKGKAPTIPETDKAAATLELKNTLGEKLLKKATDQIPSGFVLFKDAIFLTIGDPVIPLAARDNKVTMTLKGTLYGFLFNEEKLTKKIAADTIEKYDGSPVYIPNIRDLTFSLVAKDSPSFADAKNINFRLSGPARLVWKLDEAKFISELLGKPKKEFAQILFRYANINSAELHLTPFWRRSIPDESKKVTVIVNYPK